MPAISSSGFSAFCRSIVFKNILLFLLILLVAVLPLSLSYYRDSRDLEIQNLASKLEFFAERGASWLDVEAIHSWVIDTFCEELTEIRIDDATAQRAPSMAFFD